MRLKSLGWQVFFVLAGVIMLEAALFAQSPPQAKTIPGNSTDKIMPTEEVLSPPQAPAALSSENKAEGAAQAKDEPAGPINVTLDFKDADIRNVLKILAFKSGVNIVATNDVVGNVNIRLVDVPWQKALDTIVKTYGFGYEWLNDRVIMVSTLTKLAEQRKSQEEASENEPLDSDTFVLNFSKAEDIKNVLEKLVSARGKITVEQRTNTLIIADTKSNLLKIGEALKRLDKMTPQVMIEAKIIETTLSNAEKLGIDWNLRIAVSGSKRPITFPWVSGPIKGTGSKLFPKVQSPSSLEIVNTTETANNVTTVSYEEKVWNSLVSGFPQVSSSLFTFGTLDFTGLQAILEILKSSSDTKIISNPRITTLNNEKANIFVGQVIPIPRYEYSKETGTMTIAGYSDEKVGIELIVTPNINEQDFVTLNVEPIVAEIIGSTGPNGERPIIANRSAKTNVMIKDGDTLVIGGLISENKNKASTGIPILKDLPILRYIFGRKSDTLTKTELLIFITPHIIRQQKPILEKVKDTLDRRSAGS